MYFMLLKLVKYASANYNKLLYKYWQFQLIGKYSYYQRIIELYG